MIDYVPFVTASAQTEGYTEVKFTIRKISHGLRSEIRQKLAPAFAKIREKTERIERLILESGLDPDQTAAMPESAQLVIPLKEDGTPESQPTLGTRKFTPEQMVFIERIGDINNEISIITASEVDFVYLQKGFVSIEGIKIEGKEPDARLLYEKGPELLCKEIVAAIKAEAGLPAVVKLNLESPITSGAVVDGQTRDLIAPGVSEIAGTQLEIAADTSQTV